MRQPFQTAISMSHNAKAWNFKHALSQKQEPCRAKTL